MVAATGTHNATPRSLSGPQTGLGEARRRKIYLPIMKYLRNNQSKGGSYRKTLSKRGLMNLEIKIAEKSRAEKGS